MQKYVFYSRSLFCASCLGACEVTQLLRAKLQREKCVPMCVLELGCCYVCFVALLLLFFFFFALLQFDPNRQFRTGSGMLYRREEIEKMTGLVFK